MFRHIVRADRMLLPWCLDSVLPDVATEAIRGPPVGVEWRLAKESNGP